MTTNSTMTAIAAKALPALSGDNLVYNAKHNVYLTQGYTSAAGNTYFKAIRGNNRLLMYFDIGQGYAYTFLNGITLYAWDGNRAKVIGQRRWGGSNWVAYSDAFAREQCIGMLKDYLAGQARLLNGQISDSQLREFSRNMVDETYQKCIA